MQSLLMAGFRQHIVQSLIDFLLSLYPLWFSIDPQLTNPDKL